MIGTFQDFNHNYVTWINQPVKFRFAKLSDACLRLPYIPLMEQLFGVRAHA